MGEDVVRTGTVERSDREAFWHHVLADTFAAVQLEGWTRHGMEPAAQLSATRRGRLLFAALEATPHVHRRTPRQIRQADPCTSRRRSSPKVPPRWSKRGGSHSLAAASCCVRELATVHVDVY